MGAGVQNARLSDALKRTYGFKESLSVEVVPDVIPTQEMTDVLAPENYRLRGENLWTQAVVIASAAAQAARVQIGFDPANFPPKGSFITIIDQLRVQAAVVGQLFLNLVPNLNNLATGIVVRYRDGRHTTATGGVSPFGVTQLTTDTPGLGVAGSSMGTYTLAGSNVEYVIPLGVVLVPFTRLDVTLNTANNTLNVFALGRERFLDPSEAF